MPVIGAFFAPSFHQRSKRKDFMIHLTQGLHPLAGYPLTPAENKRRRRKRVIVMANKVLSLRLKSSSCNESLMLAWATDRRPLKEIAIVGIGRACASFFNSFTHVYYRQINIAESPFSHLTA